MSKAKALKFVLSLLADSRRLIQGFLCDHRGVGAMKGCFQACGRLLSHLDAQVKQANGEATGDFAGDPQTIVLMDFRRLHQGLFHLVHVIDAQMTILQDQPSARDEGCIVPDCRLEHLRTPEPQTRTFF